MSLRFVDLSTTAVLVFISFRCDHFYYGITIVSITVNHNFSRNFDCVNLVEVLSDVGLITGPFIILAIGQNERKKICLDTKSI